MYMHVPKTKLCHHWIYKCLGALLHAKAVWKQMLTNVDDHFYKEIWIVPGFISWLNIFIQLNRIWKRNRSHCYLFFLLKKLYSSLITCLFLPHCYHQDNVCRLSAALWLSRHRSRRGARCTPRNAVSPPRWAAAQSLPCWSASPAWTARRCTSRSQPKNKTQLHVCWQLFHMPVITNGLSQFGAKPMLTSDSQALSLNIFKNCMLSLRKCNWNDSKLTVLYHSKGCNIALYLLQ